MTVLDPEIHRRLLEEIDDVARTAGIPRRFIETSMTDYCGEQELKWIKGYRDHAAKGQYGLCYVGADHTQQMMALAGAFTRNFVLASVMTLTDLLDQLREGTVPSASVLFVPSFHRDKGGVTPFQINLLWGLLESRLIAEKQTVISIGSSNGFKADYGEAFAQLIASHYRKIG